jgi:CHRD domain
MIRRMMFALLAAMLVVGMTASTVLAADRRVVVLATVLTGEAEVPGPGDEDAIGAAVVIVHPRTDTVCWAVTWKKIDGTVNMAHIHGPAGTDAAAGIVVTLFMDRQFAGRGVHANCVRNAETEAWADDIAAEPSQFYVNVHSTTFPAGAIRGQLD